MKAIDFLITVNERSTGAGAYVILSNDPNGLSGAVTPKTFGQNVANLYGTIPSGPMAVVYFEASEGVDLANALYRRFGVAPDASYTVDGNVVGLYKLQ